MTGTVGVEYRPTPCLKSAVSNNFDWEDTVRPILIAIMLLFATNGAFALSKHETDMALIDAALTTAKLTPSQRAEVVRDRQEAPNFTTQESTGRLRSFSKRPNAS
jgi:hypothetical protein